MSNGYIGTYPKFAIYAPEKLAKGTTTKTLQYAPGSAYAILVVVGGAIQEPNVAYTVAGNVITFTETLPYDGWVQYRGLEGKDATDFIAAAGDPVLAVRWAFSRDHIWDGFAALDGQELSRALYPSAWEAIQADLVPVVDDAAWLADPTKRGSFTKGNGSTTFRVPDFNGVTSGSIKAPFLRGDGGSASDDGTIIKGGVPNITGYASFSSLNIGGFSGAIFDPGTRDGGVLPGTATPNNITDDISFDASKSPAVGASEVYGSGSTEVRPNSVRGCYVVKLFAGIANAGVADLQQVLVTLAGKMDKTKYEFGVPMIGVPFYWPSDKMPDEVYPELKGMHFIQARGDNFDAELYPKLATVYPTNKLPDLRGEFIRGWDDGRNVDAGRTILSSQSQSIQEHIHNTQIKTNGSPVQLPGNYYNVTLHAGARGELDDLSKNMRTTNIVDNLPNETRPRNVAYNIIVRAL